MVRRAPWWSFLLLMSVAFLNHESALFLGVWMVAQAFANAWIERRSPDWGMLGGGVLGSLGGILLIEFLRRSLLEQETGPEIYGINIKRTWLGFANLQYLARAWRLRYRHADQGSARKIICAWSRSASPPRIGQRLP